MLRRALDETGGCTDEEFGPWYAALLAHYTAHIAVHSRPYPGCEAALDALNGRGCKLAVVTNKFEHLAVQLLDEIGMASRFACIIGGDTMGPGRAKPAPDPIHEAIRRTGASRAAMVGDTTYDIGAAHAAGVPSIAVSFGFIDRAIEELGASATIDHYDQLLTTLEKL